ncbi:MAG: hypothetical protein NT139_00360 [Candidatus Woesearchaeota archaeon]|nr:hypothetical protein [Candidatus Woesearchaeota archaeon]
MKSKKRGAIELSMTTIIVVIMGITLLTLGLRWVYGIFGDIEKQRTQMNDAMDKQIRDMFGESDKPLNLLMTSISIEQGKSYDLGIAIRNTGNNDGQHFSYDITVDQIPSNANVNSVKNWFIYSKNKEFTLNSGQIQSDLVSINVPKTGAPLGTYRVTIKLTCREDNNLNYEQPLIIRII